MVAFRERLGRTIEDLGKGLQSRESERFEDTPYGNAQGLWRVLAPGREINPLKSAFLRLGAYHDEGVKTESEGQNIFSALLTPYIGLFPELDYFLVSLSLSGKSDDVSFKLTVFVPPQLQQSTHDSHYPVLMIRELPEQKLGGARIPYDMVIKVEGKFYTGALDKDFVGLGPKKEGIFKERRTWLDRPEGDIEWRRHFASETLKLLTKIAETGKEDVVNSNREKQGVFREREKKVSLFTRTFWDKRQPGAVWPDNINLSMMRRFPPNQPQNVAAFKKVRWFELSNCQ